MEEYCLKETSQNNKEDTNKSNKSLFLNKNDFLFSLAQEEISQCKNENKNSETIPEFRKEKYMFLSLITVPSNLQKAHTFDGNIILTKNEFWLKIKIIFLIFLISVYI